MAINLAEKYEKKVQERFALSSRTDAYVGKDYEFTGVKTIKIYSVDTVPMVDYTRSGTSRFGSLTELADSLQELTVEKDRGFTFSIDAGNAAEQFNIKQANASLKRQIDEVITPEIDKYRFASWAAGKGLSEGKSILTAVDGALDKDTFIEAVLTGGAKMSDEMVPNANRVIFIPELTYVKFRLSDVMQGGSDTLTAENIRKGYRGELDGMHIVTVPTSLFPSGVNFIIKYKGATVDPVKLRNYRIHKNPMGVDGDVVEGRVIYDSFVLDSKAKGIFVSKTA